MKLKRNQSFIPPRLLKIGNEVQITHNFNIKQIHKGEIIHKKFKKGDKGILKEKNRALFSVEFDNIVFKLLANEIEPVNEET